MFDPETTDLKHDIKLFIIFINTNEIPGELLSKNMIIFTCKNNIFYFTGEKITVAMATYIISQVNFTAKEK